MKRILSLIMICMIYSACHSQAGWWTWMNGTRVYNLGHNGTKGVANSANYPSGRYQAYQWTDLDGNFWLYGGADGIGLRCDLWKFDPIANMWTWMNGDTTANQPGVYGTMGVPSPANHPGSHEHGGTTWTDQQGRLWLHSGIAYDRRGGYGILDDMWMYDIPSDTWTWMKGSDTIRTTYNYGTLQVSATTNTPGPRTEANTSWVRSDGTLWTFGGGISTVPYPFNDVWKFDISTNNWTWMNGDTGTVPTTTLSFGPKYVELPTNSPPPGWSYSRWQDDNDNFYVQGNHDYGATWKYNSTTNLWSWVSGSSAIHDLGNLPIRCNPDTNYHPGYMVEYRTAMTTLGCQKIWWMFGGYWNTAGNSNALLAYNPDTRQWTWVSGIPNGYSAGVYGTMGVPAATNTPRSRSGHCFWSDRLGNLWVFGTGNSYIGDMWKFVPDPACFNAAPMLRATLSDSVICTSDSALLTVTGGIIDTITPALAVSRTDSVHATFRPAANASYTVITSYPYPCTIKDTFHFNITISPTVATPVSDSFCAGGKIIFGRDTIRSAGVYRDTFTNVHGCDSIVVLTATMLDTSHISISQSICQGHTYVFGGNTYSTSGIHSTTLTKANGCDSIITLNLTVLDTASYSYSQTICNGSSITFGGHSISAAGTYRDTTAGINGCDSFTTLILSVQNPITTPISLSICQGATTSFHGQSLSTTGIYQDTLTSSGGCDSIIVLTLTVNDTSSTSVSQTICRGTVYDFHGQQLSTAGVFTTLLSNVNGCDSSIVLTLSMADTSHTDMQQTICRGSSFSFHGQNLTTAGTYLDTLTNQNGCDSIISLALTVNDTSLTVFNQSICSGSSYTFQGRSLSAAGSYQAALTNALGCDSTLVLNLQVSAPSTTNLFDTICNGAVVIVNGTTYSTSGIYRDTLHSLAGCDSVVALTLSVFPKPVAAFLIQPMGDSVELGNITVVDQSHDADSVLWLLNDQFITLSSGGSLPITNEGNYCLRLIATSRGGCSDTSSHCLYVYGDAFYIPDAFTPNGDGVNDYMEIYGVKKSIKYLGITIYDRWGEKVYESNDIDFRWDGRYRGTLIGPGVLTYELDLSYLNGNRIHNKGSITIIR